MGVVSGTVLGVYCLQAAVRGKCTALLFLQYTNRAKLCIHVVYVRRNCIETELRGK